MKRIILALLVPLVISATAVAAPNPASANAHCKNLMRKTPAMFAPASGFQYADLAACVAAKSAQAAKNTTNAAKTCKAAQAANPEEFAKTYSSTGNGKSNGKASNGKAMGACVSATAKASTAEQQKTELNAAKKCKAERSMSEADFKAGHSTDKTFAQYYGKNKNGKNAFGKCVSAAAKAQQS